MIKKIIGVCVLVAILVYVAYPIIMWDDSYSPYPTDDSWQYDDYRSAKNVLSVDGALELVQGDDATYIHAKDVGEGTINYKNGKTNIINVEKAKLDVFFALGQSNNAYMSHDKTTADPIPQIGTAYYYGDANAPTTGLYQPSDAAMMPMSSINGVANIGDKAPAFCANYNSITHHKVYYVIGAWSSSSIDGWIPNGQYWDAAKTILSNAVDAVDSSLYELNYKGYTWIQGEANGSMSVSEYMSKFLLMHDAILAGDLGQVFDHCFISKVASQYSGPSNAQIQLATQYDTITLSTTIADTFTIANGLMASDGLHYTQAGDNLIGTALANSCADWYAPESESMDMLHMIAPAIIAILAVAIIFFFWPRKID